MPWFLVDDGFAFHRKTVAAGNAAVGLWARAGSWCGRELTDGFVPDHMVPSLGTRAQAKRLVEVGLWVRVEGGYRFWQWNDPGRQPTREQVEEKRAAARERMRRVRTNGRGSREQVENEQENTQRSSGVVRDAFPSPSPSEGRGSVDNPPPDRNGHATPQTGEGEDQQSPDQARLSLVAEVRQVRPEWSERSILRALTQPSVLERPFDVVRHAILNVAGDRASHAPGRLEHDGPWWRLPEPPSPPPRVPSREEPYMRPRRTAEIEATKDRRLAEVRAAAGIRDTGEAGGP